MAGCSRAAWPGAVWSDLVLERTGLSMDATGKSLGATVMVDKHKDAEIPGPKSFDMVPVEIPADWMPNVSDPRQLRTLVAVPTDSPHTSVAPMEDRATARQQHADTVATWPHQQHTETGRVPDARPRASGRRRTGSRWATTCSPISFAQSRRRSRNRDELSRLSGQLSRTADSPTPGRLSVLSAPLGADGQDSRTGPVRKQRTPEKEDNLTKEDERIERAVTAGRRELLRTGVMKRQELRRALNKRADVADVLVEAGIANEEPAMHGSWRLVLTGTAQKPDEKVGLVATR